MMMCFPSLVPWIVWAPAYTSIPRPPQHKSHAQIVGPTEIPLHKATCNTSWHYKFTWRSLSKAVNMNWEFCQKTLFCGKSASVWRYLCSWFRILWSWPGHIFYRICCKSITMCPPGYHHNGFMATPELGHRMYDYTLNIMGKDCIVKSPECSNCQQWVNML